MTRITRLTSRRISRRTLLAAMPGAVLLAAGVSCGDDEDAPTTTSAPANPTATSQAAVPTTSTGGDNPTATAEPDDSETGMLRLIPLSPAELGAPDTPDPLPATNPDAQSVAEAIAEYDGLGTDAAPGVFPRTIRHAMGETTIESKPQRVVVLDSGEEDSVIRMGLKPVGALEFQAELLPDYLLEGLSEATTVGTLAEPDLEAIAALEPDLILSSKLRHEPIYDRLASIAPTVFGVSTGVIWKQNFALHAQALGREEEAHEAVLEYEARVREMNANLPDPRPVVSIVRLLADNVRYYQLANYSGTILRDLGLPRPDSQNVDDFALLNQSLETLGESADADFIFVSPIGGPDHDILQSPIWKAVPAVADGRFRVVADMVWMAGIGYRAALLILDEIAEELIEDGASAPETGPETALRLIPAAPSELGAPAVPDPLPASNPEALGVAGAVAQYDDFGTDAPLGVFPRTIRHAMGETLIEAQPQRVVVLDSGELDSVTRLGINPVGTLEYDVSLMADYLVDAVTGATSVGTLAEPNLEAIAALQPDLILSSIVRHEAIYDRLSAIAPTVFGVSTGVVWKQNFALHAQALGLEDVAHETVLEYEAHVREMNANLPDPRPTISIVRMLSDNVRYYQLANFSGTLLSDLGFPRPDSQNVDDFALLNQSIETLGEFADADFVFASPISGPDEEMLNSPAWLAVPAVADGRFRVVLDDVWMAGIGYRAARQIMDEIAEELID